jgi:hypothetical protein
MKDLMKVMKRGNINFSYVPVEKTKVNTIKVQWQASLLFPF